MNVLDAIKTRTSYRGAYKSTKVPREDLIKIMEAGLAAPSGCNKQTTSLIAVDDAGILSELHRLVDPQLEEAPAIICVLTQKICAYRGKCYNVQDYSAAIQNMLLAAVELGYQSCWVEGHITDEDAIGRKIANVLNVPEDYDLVCILPIGIAEEATTSTDKMPFEERAWFNWFRKQLECAHDVNEGMM